MPARTPQLKLARGAEADLPISGTETVENSLQETSVLQCFCRHVNDPFFSIGRRIFVSGSCMITT